MASRSRNPFRRCSAARPRPQGRRQDHAPHYAWHREERVRRPARHHGIRRARCPSRSRGHVKRPNAAQIWSAARTSRTPRGRTGFQTGGVYKSADGGESWTRVNSFNPRPMYFSQIRVDPTDYNTIYICGSESAPLQRIAASCSTPRATAASTATCTPCGSTPRTAGTCSWAPMAASTNLRPRRALGPPQPPGPRPVLSCDGGPAAALPCLWRPSGQRQLGGAIADASQHGPGQ